VVVRKDLYNFDLSLNLFFLKKYPEITTTTRPRASITTTRSQVTTRRQATTPITTPTPTAKLRRSSTPTTNTPTLKTTTTTLVEGAKSPDFPDGSKELSSDDFSYLYSEEYYDELVPEHHRFLQLEATALASSNRTKLLSPGGSTKSRKNNRVNSNAQFPAKTPQSEGQGRKQGQTSVKGKVISKTPIPGFTPSSNSIEVKICLE
jgi:hypothetical protein